jgi:hypothetical protein
MPLFRGELAMMHPKFPEGSDAAVIESGQPTPMDAPTLVYTKEDDKAIEIYTREFGERTSISLTETSLTCFVARSIHVMARGMMLRVFAEYG